MLWVFGDFLCLFLCLHFSCVLYLPPHSELELPVESLGQRESTSIIIIFTHSSLHPEGHQTNRQKLGIILLPQGFPADLCISSLFKILFLLQLRPCVSLHAPNSVAYVFSGAENTVSIATVLQSVRALSLLQLIFNKRGTGILFMFIHNKFRCYF